MEIFRQRVSDSTLEGRAGNTKLGGLVFLARLPAAGRRSLTHASGLSLRLDAGVARLVIGRVKGGLVKAPG